MVFHITLMESQHLLTTAWHRTAYTSGGLEAFTVECLVSTGNFVLMRWFNSDIKLLLCHHNKEG